MAEALLRIGVLLAIFASVFLVSQLALNTLWARRSHKHAVNKRLKLLRQGNSREQIMAVLRKLSRSFDAPMLRPPYKPWKKWLTRKVL